MLEGQEFHQRIADHGKIDWAGVTEGAGAADDRVLVKVARGVMSLPVSEVLARDWPNLEAVMMGREPNIVHHQTRIVGYWSRVRNWNRSAVAQLVDRQAGTYAVPEAC